MIHLFYLSIILQFGLFTGVQSASVIALDDDLDKRLFVADKNGGLHKTVGNLHIFIDKYVQKGNPKNCIQVLSLQPASVDFLLDSVKVTCDVVPPFHNVQGVVNIADLVYVSANPGQDVWALFRLPGDKGCALRRYMGKDWVPLDEVDEMHLNQEQCFQVILTREYSTVGEPIPHPKPDHNVPFPEFGNAQGEVLKLGDEGLDEYQNDVNSFDLEESGAFTKIVSTRVVHPNTKKCVDLVHIDMVESEDFLDIVQLSCADSVFVKAKGLIAFRGLVYLRDQQEYDNPIWAVYYMQNHCVLRIYTDKEHKMIEKKTRTLTTEECKKVIDTQRINWLPKDKKKPAKLTTSQKPQTGQKPGTTGAQTQTATGVSVTSKKPLPFSAMLDYLQTLIVKQVTWLNSKVPFAPKTPPGSPKEPQKPQTEVQTETLPPQPINIVETPPPVTPQPLTENLSKPPAATAQTASSLGLAGSLMNTMGLANAPGSTTAPKPSIPVPPPLPPAPVPPAPVRPTPEKPKKGWFSW